MKKFLYGLIMTPASELVMIVDIKMGSTTLIKYCLTEKEGFNFLYTKIRPIVITADNAIEQQDGIIGLCVIKIAQYAMGTFKNAHIPTVS